MDAGDFGRLSTNCRYEQKGQSGALLLSASVLEKMKSWWEARPESLFLETHPQRGLSLVGVICPVGW